MRRITETWDEVRSKMMLSFLKQIPIIDCSNLGWEVSKLLHCMTPNFGVSFTNYLIFKDVVVHVESLSFLQKRIYPIP